ncbi:VanZ family protein [Nocardioides dubius]
MRRAPMILLGAYLVAVAFAVFQPQPEAAVGAVVWVEEALVSWGLSETLVSGTRVEFVLNALLFAPISFLGRWVWPKLRWTDWVAYAFVGSVAVELTQGLLFPDRSAQFVDVVSNTSGGLIGAVAAALVTRLKVPATGAVD